MTSGTTKPAYRAYQIGQDNHIVASVLIEAETDGAAIQQLDAIAGGRAFELWDRDRLVTRTRPDGFSQRDGAGQP